MGDLFTNSPRDHKNLIYNFLEIKDLISIGQVCKTFYNDEFRWKELMHKVVDAHFLQEISEFKILSHYKKILIQSGREKELIEQYVKKLISFEFCDKISKDAKKQFISFDPNYFKENECKKQIIDVIGKNIYRLWEYAEKNKQDMFFQDPKGFEYYVLYRSLENILKCIFLSNPDPIKQLVFNTIRDLENQTINSQKDIVNYNQDYYYFFRNTNQINSLFFIAHVDHYLFFELNPILETGDFLSTQTTEYDTVFLYHYLRERFDSFLDLENLSYDMYLDEFIEVLNEKYSETITKKERLFELFVLSNYHVQDLFERSLYWRQKRIEEDEYIQEEDYDF